MTDNVHTPAEVGITWVPCPRCNGEGGFAIDTPDGVITVGCSAPGCLDGHVAREVAQ